MNLARVEYYFDRQEGWVAPLVHHFPHWSVAGSPQHPVPSLFGGVFNPVFDEAFLGLALPLANRARDERRGRLPSRALSWLLPSWSPSIS